jgi:GxxExxY protein
MRFPGIGLSGMPNDGVPGTENSIHSIVVELKAVSELAEEHKSQLFNYLHATKLRLGLLVNFGHYPKLEYERIVI